MNILPWQTPRHKFDLKKESKLISKNLRGLWASNLIKTLLVVILLLVISPIILFWIYWPSVQPDINYGVTFSNKYSEELGMDWQETYIAILDDLGAENLRLVAYWDEVEPERDQYDYSKIMWQLDEAEARGLNVILAMGRKAPRWPECFEPEWWKQIESREVRNHELYEYIKETTLTLRHYDSIKIWQVENEPFFPFGECQKDIRREVVEKEVAVVREIDDRPILIQDSGEGGYWFPSYQVGDYLAISMYRKIWYDFWGIFLGNFIYFEYPLPYWSYKVKAGILGIPYENVFVTELQGEPWGPRINSELTQEEKDRTMSREDFFETMSYAQRAGFKDLYLWGAEWWLWEKDYNDNPYFWNTAKALFN